MQINIRPSELSTELQNAILEVVNRARAEARLEDGQLHPTKRVSSAGHVKVALTVYDDNRVEVYWDNHAA